MKVKYLVFFVLFFLILDQVTKELIVASFQLHESREIIPNFFNLVLVHNYGVAFGFMSGWEPLVRSITIGVISILALGFIVEQYLRVYRGSKLLSLALAMILAGAVGNIIDRFRYGAVIDFLDFYFKDYHWPAFNVADSCICVGVFILIIWGSAATKETTNEESS